MTTELLLPQTTIQTYTIDDMKASAAERSRFLTYLRSTGKVRPELSFREVLEVLWEKFLEGKPIDEENPYLRLSYFDWSGDKYPALTRMPNLYQRALIAYLLNGAEWARRTLILGNNHLIRVLVTKNLNWEQIENRRKRRQYSEDLLTAGLDALCELLPVSPSAEFCEFEPKWLEDGDGWLCRYESPSLFRNTVIRRASTRIKFELRLLIKKMNPEQKEKFIALASELDPRLREFTRNDRKRYGRAPGAAQKAEETGRLARGTHRTGSNTDVARAWGSGG